VVPLTMPMTWSMGSPSSDSRNGRRRGMPPATAASNSTSTPDAAAASNSSAPAAASSSLLAVMTGLPDSDDLDDDVDGGIHHHRCGVAGEHRGGQGQLTRLAQVPHRHPGDLQLQAGADGDAISLGLDQLHQGATHCSATQEPDSYRRDSHADHASAAGVTLWPGGEARPTNLGVLGNGRVGTHLFLLFHCFSCVLVVSSACWVPGLVVAPV
jgi:hypothetical protein